MTSDRTDHHEQIDGGPLRELVDRYVECVALFDAASYRTLWTPDAVWAVDGRGDIVGPEAITALFERLRAPQELAVQRVMSGRARRSGEHGVGRWVIHSVTRTDGVGTELIGVYDDRYERGADGVWRFSRRGFSPLYRGERDLPGRVWPPPPPSPLGA